MCGKKFDSTANFQFQYFYYVTRYLHSEGYCVPKTLQSQPSLSHMMVTISEWKQMLEKITFLFGFLVGGFRRKTQTIVVTSFFKTNELTDFINFISWHQH